MSILIKNMEMPKGISSNCHRTITLVISSDGLVYDVDRNRLPAVAVEVPEPHGRLIDADELEIDKVNYETYNDYSEAFDMIDNAPTVIEAEE